MQKVPFLLESKLKEEGAQYTKGQDWHSHAVFDDKLITGASNGLCSMRPFSMRLTSRACQPDRYCPSFCLLLLSCCFTASAGQNPASSPAVGQLILQQL